MTRKEHLTATANSIYVEINHWPAPACAVKGVPWGLLPVTRYWGSNLSICDDTTSFADCPRECSYRAENNAYLLQELEQTSGACQVVLECDFEVSLALKNGLKS